MSRLVLAALAGFWLGTAVGTTAILWLIIEGAEELGDHHGDRVGWDPVSRTLVVVPSTN